MDHLQIVPVIKRLDEHGIPYSLGGSAMMYCFGITDTVRDWDLIVEAPKEAVKQALREFEYVEGGSGDYPFASQYRLSIPAMDIDLIGYFAFHTDGGIVPIPVEGSRLWDGIRVSSLEAWYVAYHLMGRRQKADSIRDYLLHNKDRMNREMLTRFLDSGFLDNSLKNEIRLLLA
jgi:hypothetical protein